MWVVLACMLGLAALATIVRFAGGPVRSRGGAGQAVVLDAGLASRLADVTAAIATAPAWSPAAQPDAPPSAAAIEAALIAGTPKRALELAETALATDPANRANQVWLAWALVAADQADAALVLLPSGSSASSGARESSGARAEAGATAVLAAYVRARAEHLVFEHSTGAVGALPPLITTADLAVVTLASGRGGAMWLKGEADIQIDAADAQAAIAVHRAVTGRCLDLALTAVALAPGFADAGYLCARLAVKSGLVIAGKALFAALTPKLIGRPDADAFTRDAADLAQPEAAVAAAKVKPPVASTAKRSRSLKVL